jgi:hypothetical protein
VLILKKTKNKFGGLKYMIYICAMVRNFIQGLLNIIFNIMTSVLYSKVMLCNLAKGLSIKFRSVKADLVLIFSPVSYGL